MHHEAISSHYSQIIMAITVAASCTVPKIPCSLLRPFWTEDVDDLKSDSVFWYHMWRDAGYPSSGWLCHIKNSCKFKYKLAVKQAFRAYENAHCDELDAHFLNKNIPEFWKL